MAKILIEQVLIKVHKLGIVLGQEDPAFGLLFPSRGIVLTSYYHDAPKATLANDNIANDETPYLQGMASKSFAQKQKSRTFHVDGRTGGEPMFRPGRPISSPYAVG